MSFNASDSNDQDPGDTLNFTWDFGDGTPGTGVTSSHTYNSEGSYLVTLMVQDSTGSTDTAVTTITVSIPVTGGSLVVWGQNWGGLLCNVPSGNDYVAIAAGETHSLALRN
ncbi:hypothetical protein ES703_100036 [subsurface metagenome]